MFLNSFCSQDVYKVYFSYGCTGGCGDCDSSNFPCDEYYSWKSNLELSGSFDTTINRYNNQKYYFGSKLANSNFFTFITKIKDSAVVLFNLYDDIVLFNLHKNNEHYDTAQDLCYSMNDRIATQSPPFFYFLDLNSNGINDVIFIHLFSQGTLGIDTVQEFMFISLDNHFFSYDKRISVSRGLIYHDPSTEHPDAYLWKTFYYSDVYFCQNGKENTPELILVEKLLSEEDKNGDQIIIKAIVKRAVFEKGKDIQFHIIKETTEPSGVIQELLKYKRIIQIG